MSGREKKRAFSCTLSGFGQSCFLAAGKHNSYFFPGPKQCKAGNTIKIGVSAEIAKKQKKKSENDTFFWKKVFFDMVEKVGFTNCVFEKLCFPENTIFIVFSANTAFQK